MPAVALPAAKWSLLVGVVVPMPTLPFVSITICAVEAPPAVNKIFPEA